MGAYKTVLQSNSLEDAINNAMDEIEALAEEADSWKSNMEGTALESTEKYSNLSELHDALSGANRPDTPDGEQMGEIVVTASISVPRAKKYNPSRNNRLGNAVSWLNAAKDAIDNWLEEETDEEAEHRDAMETLGNDIDDIVGAIDGLEFPGMYG